MLKLAKKNYSQLPKRQKAAIKKKIGWVCLTAFVFFFFIGTIFVAWANKDLPDPDKLTDRQVDQSTKIYDRTGEHLLYEIFADKKRTIVEMDEIPRDLVNGVIATEDKTFYEHKGVRPLSILRAVFYGIFSSKKISGTSTLTQQLVKNAILTNERTYTRKLKEIILSIRLEQKYTKEQILKIYFNEIPYGSTNYGVESAAQSYFGKHVADLTLAESATLAGLPKAPSTYLNNLEMLKQRRNFVLQRMFEEGYINEEQKNTAQAESLNLEVRYQNIKAPHFVLYVKEQLVEKYGEQMVDTGGLKVITSLDLDKQNIAEKIIKDENKTILEEAGADNVSLVATDPKTGQILAMIGSRDFFNEEIDGQFNVATLGKRQPGSSFKPIIYTAAFEMGYTPETLLFDVTTNFSETSKPYIPKNYDLGERGAVTMREALQGSLNIPAVKTLYLVGDKKGVSFAERLGYTTLSNGDFGLSLVLGGGEVKLLEHTLAYSVFANGGYKVEPVSILKIEDRNGEVIEEWKQGKLNRILDSRVTSLISNVLSDDAARAYVFGRGGVLTLPDRPVAAKTGTTNNYVDAWTMGYTPSLAVGVWAGNTDNTPMSKGYGGNRVAGAIWNKFMREATKTMPVEGFPAPPPNDATKPILRGSNGGGVTLPINKVTGRIATSSTPPEYIVERTYMPAHSILHYVVKSDPRGPAPTNPANDPQYNNWEFSIQNWIERKRQENPDWEISFDEPPIEFDTPESLEFMPTIEIISPTPSSTLFSRQIITNINFSSPRGINKVLYQIDGNYVGAISEYPFNLNYYARDLENGPHTLTITAEDDMGNKRIEEVIFTLEANIEKPIALWNQKNTELTTGDIPYTFFLNPFKLNEIKSVNIYKNTESGKELLQTISDFNNIFNNQISFVLSNTTTSGNYEFIAETILQDDSISGEDIMILTIK